MDWQLQNWIAAQLSGYRASLHQALFDTEQVAKRVAATIPHDAFAAAVISHFWLQRIAGLTVGSFGDITEKRAWSAATETLQAAVRRGQAECNDSIGRFIAALSTWHGLVAQIRGDRDTHVGEARVRAADARSRLKANTVTLAIGVGAAAGCFPIGVVFNLLAEGTGGCLAILSLLAGVAVLIHGGVARGRLTREFEDAHALVACREHDVAALDAFLASPTGGGFLSQTWSQHPLLHREPAPSAEAVPVSQATPSVQVYVDRQVVERQVVVVRCRYCSQITPADLHGCSHCGASL